MRIIIVSLLVIVITIATMALVNSCQEKLCQFQGKTYEREGNPALSRCVEPR